MKFALALVAAAGLAATANAQSTSRVIFESSFDNGASWAGGAVNRTVAPNSTVNMMVRARIVLNGTDTVLGLAGITFQPKLTGWGAGDVRNPFTTADGSGVSEEPQTNTGRILPFASSGMGSGSASGLLTSHVDGGNTLRFAGANAVAQTTNLAWGVSSGQVPPNLANPPSSFRSGTDVVVFRYSVSLAVADMDRDLSALCDVSAILQTRASWYRNPNGAGSLLATVGANDMIANNIHLMVPAPGALALAGLGGLVVARRRR